MLVLLDLSAAFDTIDHATLVRRLEHHFGISGRPLTDRYQTVCVNGELSTPVHMEYSVPQGSVLGPKNYVMYHQTTSITTPFLCRRHTVTPGIQTQR